MEQKRRGKRVINQPKFEGAIRAAGYTEGRLARKIGMSANTFSMKKKKGTFTLAQVDKICMECHIEDPEHKREIFLL